MTERIDIEKLRATIERVIGIVVRPEVSSLEQFCVERLAARQLSSVDEYVDLLMTGGLYGEELTAVAEHFAVRESHFYRDPKQLAVIERVIQARHAKERRPVSVWVAACATGEEAYTLAMIARMGGVPLRILATDINERLISVAKAGVYDGWSIRRLPPEILARFFTSADGLHTLAPEIRDCVELRIHNLLDPAMPLSTRPDGKWDFILCRNVLIYFEEETVREVTTRIVASLHTHGLLFLSSAESLHGKCPALRTVQVEGGFAYAAATDPENTIASRARTPSDHSPFHLPLDPGPYHTISLRYAALSADATAESLCTRRETGTATAHEQLFLAGLLIEMNRPELAVDILSSTLEREPFLAEGHYLIGRVEQMCSRFDTARASLRKAVFLDPRFWPAVYTLASVLKSVGDFGSAAALYARTSELLEQFPSLGDRDYLPAVRDLIPFRTAMKDISRCFGSDRNNARNVR